MKFIFSFLIAMAFCPLAFADSIQIGCVEREYACGPTPAGETKCIWLTFMGRAGSVAIEKTGQGPGYEIWEGRFGGIFKGKYEFQVEVFQQREVAKINNSLLVSFKVGDVTISGYGGGTAEARFFKADENFGIALRCTTELVPAEPENQGDRS